MCWLETVLGFVPRRVPKVFSFWNFISTYRPILACCWWDPGLEPENRIFGFLYILVVSGCEKYGNAMYVLTGDRFGLRFPLSTQGIFILEFHLNISPHPSLRSVGPGTGA